MDRRTKDNEKSGGSANCAESDKLYIPIPPDGGWGWVIVLASFFNSVIVEGIAYSFGVFYLEFLDYFKDSKGKTSLVGSLLTGSFLCCGPLASALTNKFGCRPVVIAGSLVSSLAFSLSTLSPNIDVLILTYGVIGGIGFGLIYLPSIVGVGYYFEKKRAVATGIAMCGSGVGTFIFAPFSNALLNYYDWKNAMLILAGIILNCCFFGALMRPLVPVGKRNTTLTKSAPDSEDDSKRTPNGSLTNNNDFSKVEVSESDKSSMSKLYPKHSKHDASNRTAHEHSPVSLSSSYPNLSTGRKEEHLLTVPGVNHSKHIGSSVSVLWKRAVKRSAGQGKIHKEDYARPLYRQDIFYSGSVLNINEFKSQPDMTSYIASITSIPDVRDIEEDTSKSWRVCCRCFPKPFVDVLSRMMDLTIFKNYEFMIICVANVFCMVGFYVPYVYIPDRAVLMGIDESKASFLVSIMGIANTIGRVLFGLLSDHPKVNALLVNNVTMTIAAIATILSPFCQDYPTLVVYCAVFGLTVSAYSSLTSIILCDLLGLQQLTTAFGVLTLARGLASIVGSPIAGTVYDETQSYETSFYMAGALILTGAILHFTLFLPCLRQTKPGIKKLCTKYGEEYTCDIVVQTETGI